LIAQQKEQENKEINIQKEQAQVRREVATQSFRIKAALFNSNSSTLSDIAISEVKLIAERIKASEYSTITIEGHTDSVGAELENMELSKDRAISIYDELIKNDIPVNKMQVIGFGSRMPISDNRTDAGRAANRRVEIFVE
jgi:outer membrane protein OmpA-like peptidoglycan-associated protein